MSFAEQLARAPLRRAPRTSISGAIDFSVRLLQERQGDATRRVIDISGDGANNQGRRITDARDDAVAKGVTINGLPLLLKQRTASAYDVEDLDEHYRDCVIGGSSSFMMVVRERSLFAEAIRNKIIREIASRTDHPGTGQSEHQLLCRGESGLGADTVLAVRLSSRTPGVYRCFTSIPRPTR